MSFLEKEIIERIASGDEKAFELLFKSYYSILCAYAFDILKKNEWAEEVVQNTFIKIWESRAKIEINQSLKSYLYRSIHNQCINFLKHQQVVSLKRQKYIEEVKNESVADNIEEEFTLSPYFYEGLEEDIENEILALPDQCQKIFRMSRFEMLSHQDIAQRLNISVNTVKTQIRRALTRIRSSLEKKISGQNK